MEAKEDSDDFESEDMDIGEQEGSIKHNEIIYKTATPSKSYTN